jgi:hypothetical protein
MYPYLQAASSIDETIMGIFSSQNIVNAMPSYHVIKYFFLYEYYQSPSPPFPSPRRSIYIYNLITDLVYYAPNTL